MEPEIELGYVVQAMVTASDPGTPLQNIRRAGWALAAVGAIFLLLGIAVPVEIQLDLATKSGRATGIVVDHVLYQSASGSLSVRPVIDFTTATGTRERFEAPTSWPGVADQTGQKVKVAYNPSDPGKAAIDDIRDELYPLFLCFALGLFGLLGGTWVLTRFTSVDESAREAAA